MPAFNRTPFKFVHTGMRWDRSIDTIPDQQVCFARNLRVYQQEQITTRPGLALFSAGFGSYTHTISRLNNFNPQVNFSQTYVVGSDQQLYVGLNAAAFADATRNPVKTPGGAGHLNGFSGNPLSLIDYQPSDASSPWAYIGDSSQMVTAGYYPGDNPAVTMARALTIGMLPPVWNPAITINGGGLLNGNYQWIVQLRRTFTGARSNPSAATRATQAVPATALTNQSVTFTLPAAPTDPQTGAADANVVADVYRFGGVVFSWRLVGSQAAGTSFTDNLPDAQVLTNPQPSQATDPVTGLTRFNLFQPFISPDVAHFDTANATISKVAGGDGTNTIWILTAGGADTFNTAWLPGSAISITDQVTGFNGVFTIYQVRSSTVIELLEDATGTLGAGNACKWAVPAGTLFAGNPLPHIWGPFGLGETGAFVFGCGDPRNAGTLYWTNGNDPDSTDIVNSLQVTSPSEPLRGGCMYDGRAFVWSTERMFAIYPSTTVAGQFIVEEVPGAKGLFQEFSLSVQSGLLNDISVSWISKSGVENFQQGAGGATLSDQGLYSFLPHDNQAGQPLAATFPFLASENVNPPDPAQTKYQRLTWFDGLLFYDFKDTAGVYATLVYDSRMVGGWVSYDLYTGDTLPIGRGIEIAAHNLKVALGSKIFDYTGSMDNGSAFSYRLVTKSYDLGDARASKLVGEIMLDANPAGGVIAVLAELAYNTTTSPVGNQTGALRSQIVSNLNSGIGLLTQTIGLSLSGTTAVAAPVLYQWEPSWYLWPEYSTRVSGWTNCGMPQSKFMQGFVLPMDTQGVAVVVRVHYNNGGALVTVDMPAVTTPAGQKTPVAFSFATPFIAEELQFQPLSPGAAIWPDEAEWVFEPVPELAATWETQQTNHDIPGWHYLGPKAWIAYIGSADAPNLAIITDYGTANVALPVSNGVYTRAQITPPPGKAKWRQYIVTSTGGVRLFKKDCAIQVKPWGSPGGFQLVMPFGDDSRASGARI